MIHEPLQFGHFFGVSHQVKSCAALCKWARSVSTQPSRHVARQPSGRRPWSSCGKCHPHRRPMWSATMLQWLHAHSTGRWHWKSSLRCCQLVVQLVQLVAVCLERGCLKMTTRGHAGHASFQLFPRQVPLPWWALISSRIMQWWVHVRRVASGLWHCPSSIRWSLEAPSYPIAWPIKVFSVLARGKVPGTCSAWDVGSGARNQDGPSRTDHFGKLWMSPFCPANPLQSLQSPSRSWISPSFFLVFWRICCATSGQWEVSLQVLDHMLKQQEMPSAMHVGSAVHALVKEKGRCKP